YCLAFEKSRHVFLPDVTLEQVYKAYEFDRILRDILTEALEIIEVDFRTAVAYRFGFAHGPFGHAQASWFYRWMGHGEWLSKVQEETKRSKEIFVTHFSAKYQEYPNLPVWIVTEVMSLGNLSRMFANMVKTDQKDIAMRYVLQPADLVSWMHHVTYIRNLCAHHSRVWDRAWSVKPALPPANGWQPPRLPSNDRLFVSLLLLNHLLKHCQGMDGYATEWRRRIDTHMTTPPAAPNAFVVMGLTPQWQAHEFWA
ncbi:MAG: Abi family protein, partial [Phycisphaerae bacterium]